MADLNYKWNSGTIPRNIMQSNMDQFCAFFSNHDTSDGFIHLLGKMISLYPMTGTLEYSIDAPYQFFYIYEGTLSLTLHGTTYTLPEGYAALLPADGETTLQIVKAKCRYFHMYLSGLSLAHYHNLLPEPFAYSIEDNSILGLSRFLTYMEELKEEEAADPLFTCQTSMWITDVLTEMSIYRNKPQTRREAIPDYITQIRDMFDMHYDENYTLEDLESTYAISKYRICREFSKYYKKSPIQYLNHVRITEAKKLLLTTDLSVHEVGNKVGIFNTNHFINLFKRETGATPLSFKQDAPVSISSLHYL